MCGGGGDVCRLAGWVCLGETRVFVCLLCGHVPAGCVLLSPEVFARCVSPSQGVRAWAVGQAKPFFGMFIVNIIILYNLQL